MSNRNILHIDNCHAVYLLINGTNLSINQSIASQNSNKLITRWQNIAVPSVSRVMSLNDDLRVYLKALKFFNILNFSYNQTKNELKLTAKDERVARITLISMLLSFAGILTASISTPDQFRLALHSQTGNYYLFIDFCFACLVICILGVFFHIKRMQNGKTIQNILHFNRECLKNCSSAYFNRLYSLYVALGIVCLMTHIPAFLWTSEISIFAFICYVTIYPLNFLYLGLLIVFYMCIMTVIEKTFCCYNAELQQLIAEQGPKMGQLVCDNLKRRHQLLTMCYEDINEIYGIAMLFVSAYIMFSAPSGLFFLVAVVFENKFESFIAYIQTGANSLLWCAPWVTVFVILFLSNGVSKEVNKTARILCKIPRLGTGMERMVEKFLTKDLSRRPIFTAYGFFSLDKATLFQIFTAICTYMVILVQFKEIESESKLKLKNSI